MKVIFFSGNPLFLFTSLNDVSCLQRASKNDSNRQTFRSRWLKKNMQRIQFARKNESQYTFNLPSTWMYAYLGVMDRDRGRVLERQASRVAVKRYRYDRRMGIVEVTESQFAAARREP